jgi:hypothetical protein
MMLNPSAASGAVSGNAGPLPPQGTTLPLRSRRQTGSCQRTGRWLAAILFLMLSAVWNCPAQNEVSGSVPTSAANARITYTRTLRGSSPEYLALSVNSNGTGSYEGRQLADPPHPRDLTLSPATAQKMFALAAELDNFRNADLNSRKKVANLGLKTFTYEAGAEKNQVQFNFTQQKQARDLVDLFEKVAGAEQSVDSLEYAIKYDPLSLPQILLSIQVALNHDDISEPELMFPWLEQISSNPRFMHVAQVRAQDILKSFGHDK